jgi:hypothetical protein
MIKVFRLHREGDTSKSGWFESKIRTKDLEEITTEGDEVSTSLPSPFAHWDLVSTAFRWVAKRGIQGKTAYHKLVSDTLDIAQLFFYYKRYKDKFEIKSWNSNRIEEISKNGMGKHKNLMETIWTYWEEDKEIEGYNFEKVELFYFLIDRTNDKVLGGTSPMSLFFPAPDARRIISAKINIGGHTILGDEPASLVRRPPDFIKYLFLLAKCTGFAENFKNLYDYLEKAKEELPAYLKREINEMKVTDLDSYEPAYPEEGSPCVFLGISLKVAKPEEKTIAEESDFVIQPEPDLAVNGPLPLVLPTSEHFNTGWTYTEKGKTWKPEWKLPVKKNEKPLDESELPFEGIKYPWLTEGNFLEDDIIEIPYVVDTTRFLVYEVEFDKQKRYFLPPLTETFFHYFKAENVKNFLKIDEKGLAGGGIVVELEIPVKKGKIKFKKIYSQPIKANGFHLGILPFFKVEGEQFPYYVGMIDARRVDKGIKVSERKLTFFNGNRAINPQKSSLRRSEGEKTYYYKIEEPFTHIRVEIDGTECTIIPLFPEKKCVSEAHFAIDFGTTNTHIEYKIENGPEKPFDNPGNDPLLVTLLKEAKDPLQKVIENDFQQEIIPKGFPINDKEIGYIGFPFRSALLYNKMDLDKIADKDFDLFLFANGYLLLDNLPIPKDFRVETELKWGGKESKEEHEKKVKKYVEFLLTLVKYKALSLGVKPEKCKVTWSYPVSMTEHDLENFRKIWKATYKELFGNEENIKGIPESIPPYLYFKSQVNGLTLSIDIGGGSSDICVFDRSEPIPRLISSVRFAGNSIFGDGLPGFEREIEQNGYVQFFQNDAEKYLENDNQKYSILKEIVEERKSSIDFSNFLFAIEGFSYAEKIKKTRKVNLPVFIFYSALAYYSANLLKRAGIDPPKYLILSGNGSKTTDIIGFSGTKEVFQFMFRKLYERDEIKIDLVERVKYPKEVTAKGALKSPPDENMEIPIKFWIGGMENEAVSKVFDKQKDYKEIIKYKEFLENENLKRDVVKGIKSFYELMDEFVDTVNFEHVYPIERNTYEVFKEIREKDLQDLLEKGIKAFKHQVDVRIAESLFFYPLVDKLNVLAYEIYKSSLK